MVCAALLEMNNRGTRNMQRHDTVRPSIQIATYLRRGNPLVMSFWGAYYLTIGTVHSLRDAEWGYFAETVVCVFSRRNAAVRRALRRYYQI